jgi:hypothetical protein
MELDDLKEKWKSTTFQSPFDLKDTLERRVNAIERSGKGLRQAFWIEMIIIGLIYAGFILTVWFMADRVMPYMYKLVIVTSIAMVPIAWRMYKSQKWINSMDYTKDVRSNMIEFLGYYKLTLRLYQWSTYIIIVIILILFYTDSDFGRLPGGIKTTLVIYLAAIAILTEPYIRVVYGRRITVFENFLND